MKSNRPSKFSPESVILTDWAIDDLSMGGSAKSTIYELMLLSLLYDNVLIQDEVFALSDKCANWFSEDNDLELLRKAFDIEALVLLKHPLFAYPTEELKELAQEAPIHARARYIQHYGSKADRIFKPSHSQLRLYHNLDAWLLKRPQAQRFVGALRRFDIMPTFGVMLKEVLSSKYYKKWRRTAFRGITDKMAEDFIGFIEDPDTVITKLQRRDRQYKTVLGQDGKPIFNRSLGFLATTLYRAEQAKAMQRLIQTTFAAPFSWRENAAGRYSKVLRELLWIPGNSLPDTVENLEEGEIVSVEAHVDTELPLPNIDTNFVEAINHVRNTDAGKQLRSSMRQLDKNVNFEMQTEAWRGVAYELASAVIKSERITIRTALVRAGNEFVTGSIASGLYHFAAGQQMNIPAILSQAFLEGGFSVVSHHIMAMLHGDTERQKLRQEIERSVEFRCSPIEIPPIATQLVNKN